MQSSLFAQSWAWQVSEISDHAGLMLVMHEHTTSASFLKQSCHLPTPSPSISLWSQGWGSPAIMQAHHLKAPKGELSSQGHCNISPGDTPQPGRGICFQANKASKSSSVPLFKSYHAAKLTLSPCYGNAS